jgi:hypothetical protein
LEDGAGPVQGEGVEQVGISGRGEVAEKGSRRMKMVQKMCAHVGK